MHTPVFFHASAASPTPTFCRISDASSFADSDAATDAAPTFYSAVADDAISYSADTDDATSDAATDAAPPSYSAAADDAIFYSANAYRRTPSRRPSLYKDGHPN